MTSSVQQHFANFHPGRALWWFIGFGTVGTTCTWFDFGTPISPAAAVLAYGAVLLYTQRQYYVYLSDELKDSPYFMGYMLTLVALVKVFHGATATGLKIDSLIHGVGVALLASAMGLFARHMLISLDYTEQSRNAVFQGLMNEVRTQATTLREAQVQLTNLIKEFSATRETLMSREEQASKLYVGRLEAGANALGQMLRDYPEATANLLAAIRAASMDMKETSDKSCELLADLGKKMEQAVRDHSAAHAVVIKHTADRIGVMEKAFVETFQSLESSSESLKEALDEQRAGIESFGEKYKESSEKVSAVPIAISDKLEEWAKSQVASQVEIERVLAAVLDDARQIDAIIAELAKELPKTLRSLGEEK